jgi:predicted RNase H-like HicB family nuclease
MSFQLTTTFDAYWRPRPGYQWTRYVSRAATREEAEARLDEVLSQVTGGERVARGTGSDPDGNTSRGRRRF